MIITITISWHIWLLHKPVRCIARHSNIPVFGIVADFMKICSGILRDWVSKDYMLWLSKKYNSCNYTIKMFQFLTQAMKPLHLASQATLQQALHLQAYQPMSLCKSLTVSHRLKSRGRKWHQISDNALQKARDPGSRKI